MRLVIVGTGRSGTNYCAELLRACGVRCGHESVFTPAVALDRRPVDWEGWEADSSWLAVPLLHSPALRDARIVLVTRHPAAVIRSWLELRVFDRGDDYTAAIARHTPATMRGPHADRALAHWASWNLLAAARADDVVRLEDLGSRHLLDWLTSLDRSDSIGEVDRALATPRDVNSRDEAKRRVGPIESDLFDPPVLRRALPVVEMFGYHDWPPA